MSTIEVIPTNIDSFESLFDHLSQPSTMLLARGTDETAVPLVSSTTTDSVSHYEQGRSIFSGKSPKEDVSSSSATTNELVEILPAGRFK